MYYFNFISTFEDGLVHKCHQNVENIMYLLLFKASHQFFFFKCVCLSTVFFGQLYVWNSYENIFRFVVKFTKQSLLGKYKFLVLFFFLSLLQLQKLKQASIIVIILKILFFYYIQPADVSYSRTRASRLDFHVFLSRILFILLGHFFTKN